ncbi:MAG: hpnC [Mycobacterium sp.]|nr:hpnC [Mycobacterium sp.]
MTNTGARNATPLSSEQVWLTSRVLTLNTARARQVNFPVASRLLRSSTRRDLLDIYVLARLIDDAGDEAPGDRLALLNFIDADICRLESHMPSLAPVAALTSAVRERGLPVKPLRDLVAANRMDQVVTRYADLAELRDYCRLSAEPVGRLVLNVWGIDNEINGTLADDVCTGLQIAEHLQDIGEDLRDGRIYVPQDMMARHGVTEELLGLGWDALTLPERAQIESLIGELAGHARRLLRAGVPLTRRMPGLARIALAGFTAGGLAALDAVQTEGARAVHVTARPRRRRVLWHTVATLARSVRG